LSYSDLVANAQTVDVLSGDSQCGRRSVSCQDCRLPECTRQRYGNAPCPGSVVDDRQPTAYGLQLTVGPDSGNGPHDKLLGFRAGYQHTTVDMDLKIEEGGRVSEVLHWLAFSGERHRPSKP
jgi:hypothetical protein